MAFDKVETEIAEAYLGKQRPAVFGVDSEGSSDQSWKMFGHSMPKSEMVFFMQVFLIYIVVITSIVILTLYKDGEGGKLWTALLSSSLGYILPNPTLKKRNA